MIILHALLHLITCRDMPASRLPSWACLQVVEEEPAIIAAVKVVQWVVVLVQPMQDAGRLVIMEVIQHPLAA